MRKFFIIGGTSLFAALALPFAAFATADPALTGATGQVQTAFTDNLPAIIALVVGVSVILWLIAMGFSAVGAKRKHL
jgi:hypothetical protein